MCNCRAKKSDQDTPIRWSDTLMTYSNSVSVFHRQSLSDETEESVLLTYLLTYSIVQSPSWEANWFAASQEIPRISRNPKIHYRTHKELGNGM